MPPVEDSTPGSVLRGRGEMYVCVLVCIRTCCAHACVCSNALCFACTQLLKIIDPPPEKDIKEELSFEDAFIAGKV